MSFHNEMPYTKVNAILDQILPEFVRISKAPTLWNLEDDADRRKISLKARVREESEKWYKSVESSSGNIYLAKNPALMSYQSMMFAGMPCGQVITRAKPKFKMTRKEALDLAEANNKAGVSSERLDAPRKTRELINI